MVILWQLDIESTSLEKFYFLTLQDVWKGRESEVTQLCPTLGDLMDCCLPGSSVHGIFQAKVLEWVAISFSKGVWGHYCCLVTKSCPLFATHGLQQARLPCPSPSPEVCSNSCPLSWWCHPTISFSVTLFFSCPQSFKASGSFPTSRLCTRWPEYWSFSFSPSSEYSGLIPLGLTGFISL